MTRHIEPAELSRAMRDAQALYLRSHVEEYQRHDDPEYIPGADLAFGIFMIGSWAVIVLIFAVLIFA